jgi:uncharacterized damage-inducible protein DinB
MLTMLQDLIRHKAPADAAMFSAVRSHEPAARDPEVMDLLHHVLVANRFWLSLVLKREFSFAEEMRKPESLDALAKRYRQTQAEEIEWISRAQASDLDRTVETQYIPGRSFSVAQGLMQVCMHGNAHRAQCAMKLRALGGTPPASDFVVWLKDRPAPLWPG